MDDILKKNEMLNENSSEDITDHALENGEGNVEPAPEDLDMRWVRWKCLVCGYVYEGPSRVLECPRCGNENPDKFDDAD